MRRLLSSVSIAIALLACAASARATVIDFEGIAAPSNVTTQHNSSIVSGGFSFYQNHGHVIDSAYSPTGYQTNNGTDWLMNDSSGEMVISDAASPYPGAGTYQPFALTSLDIGAFFTTSGAVLATGFLTGGGTVTETISVSGNFSTYTFGGGFVNLDYVRLQGVGGYGGWAIDNVTVNESVVAVPAPGAVALLGIGLIGLGFLRRRIV